MTHDIAVIGAGPAGLAAAAAAIEAGADVTVVDGGPRSGGQYWRHAEQTDGAGHHDWALYQRLAGVVEAGAAWRPEHPVWFVEPGPPFALHTRSTVVRAHHLIIATGAHDRSLPFPGWDLPGVVTPGGAQAMLRGSGVPIGERVVVAGAGPFLLPVAAALAEAGTTVVDIFEAGRPSRYAWHPAAVAGSAGKLVEAASYVATLARHRVPYRSHHAVIAAHGTTAVEAVDVARLDRHGRVDVDSARRIPCDAVAVGFGFVPQLEIPVALGCATRLDGDGSLVVAVDVAGQTSVSNVFAAGEVTGVGGAALAVAEGRLAGAGAAMAAGYRPSLSDRELTRLLSRRASLRRFAAAMHAVHTPPAGWPAWVTDDTVVCRCEEVRFSAIRSAVLDLGATDARAVKSLCRPGMGWCQGRICGYATAALAADLLRRPIAEADLAAFAKRPFALPITLADLADGQ
jgi:NADPH-dependent 2,4-dienoyl-CoA reductase/sulfur reductase-like enzyme